MADAHRIHPLQDRRFAAAGIALTPAPFAERLSLRARPDALVRLGEALGFDLPARPQASLTKDGVSALCLGPDEWLLIGAEGSAIAARLGAMQGALFSAVDISNRNTAIIVEGPLAQATLNSGCPRDLSPAAFPVNACARTVLAKSEVILLRESETRFRVECWRSLADYVWLYLVDAAKSA